MGLMLVGALRLRLVKACCKFTLRGRTQRRSEVCWRPDVGDSGALVDRQELAARRRNDPFDRVLSSSTREWLLPSNFTLSNAVLCSLMEQRQRWG
jgi:hypothetical protein